LTVFFSKQIRLKYFKKFVDLLSQMKKRKAMIENNKKQIHFISKKYTLQIVIFDKRFSKHSFIPLLLEKKT
jgi:hypothetical protein